MLKRLDIPGAAEAKVRYLEADYKIEAPGSHVLCAQTGVVIPLDELKYWSWERQEAYADHHAALSAELSSRNTD